MDIQSLQRHFVKIGAALKVDMVPANSRWFRNRVWERNRTEIDFFLDLVETYKEDYFRLTIREDRLDNLEFLAVDVQPEQRHLLLLAKRWQAAPERRKEKYLCGHDERYWFVAAVPGSWVSNVRQAMEALKPTLAIEMQHRRGVKPKHWHNRHNAGFIRQGEWFFIPHPDFEPDNRLMILRNEPIYRGGGQPHWIEYLYRTGGETVYFCSHRPNGLTEPEYRDLIRRKPQAGQWNWQIGRRNPEVYATGKIRHRDHATIELPFWHRVLMNSEYKAAHAAQVAFID